MESQFRYKAWANAQLIDALSLIDATRYAESWRMAIRLLNHTYVVDRIFAAHLVGEEHSYESTNTPETPTLEQLGQDIEKSDRWYVEYANRAATDSLKDSIVFTFTDGDSGSMTREEVLTHILVHGAYHRGNVGMLLPSCGLDRPSDTFTRFLHLMEPERRTGKQRIGT